MLSCPAKAGHPVFRAVEDAEMTRARRILSWINYALGVYVLLISVGFVTILQDAQELIEVHQWHACWDYKDYSTYITHGVVSLASLATVFFVSWGLLKSARWKFAIVSLGVGFVIFAVEFWWNADCMSRI